MKEVTAAVIEIVITLDLEVQSEILCFIFVYTLKILWDGFYASVGSCETIHVLMNLKLY